MSCGSPMFCSFSSLGSGCALLENRSGIWAPILYLLGSKRHWWSWFCMGDLKHGYFFQCFCPGVEFLFQEHPAFDLNKPDNLIPHLVAFCLSLCIFIFNESHILNSLIPSLSHVSLLHLKKKTKGHWSPIILLNSPCKRRHRGLENYVDWYILIYTLITLLLNNLVTLLLITLLLWKLWFSCSRVAWETDGRSIPWKVMCSSNWKNFRHLCNSLLQIYFSRKAVEDRVLWLTLLDFKIAWGNIYKYIVVQTKARTSQDTTLPSTVFVHHLLVLCLGPISAKQDL